MYLTMLAKVIKNGFNIYKLLNAYFQDVKTLFVLVYYARNDNSSGITSNRNYFPPRVEIKNYHVLIDGRNFYDSQLMVQSNNMIKLEKSQ